MKTITKSPNAAEIWLEWLKDEIRLTEEESNREKIYELFEKAVKDYICEYINLMCWCMTLGVVPILGMFIL